MERNRSRWCPRLSSKNRLWRNLALPDRTRRNSLQCRSSLSFSPRKLIIAPTVNLNLLHHPSARKLDHPVRVTVAASAPSASLFQNMTDHNLLPVHVYGLTEVYGPSTKNYFLPSFHDLPHDTKWSNMARWQGHGFVGTREVRVLKRTKGKTEWTEVQRDGKDVGEIVFRGNIVMKGYFNNKEGTQKAFEGGWFWSGDLAVVHPGGQIEIVDREKDIIISGIFPKRQEMLILQVVRIFRRWLLRPSYLKTLLFMRSLSSRYPMRNGESGRRLS